MAKSALVRVRTIEQAIVIVRGIRVMLDSDLAALYGVKTGGLVQSVKRNAERFPSDFMIRLSDDDIQILKSQSVISRSGHGGRRSRPYAFTEQGVAMLSSVLRSARAISVNVAIIRAFVRMRRTLYPAVALSEKIDRLERKYDAQFSSVFEAIRELMQPRPARRRRRIGFRA